MKKLSSIGLAIMLGFSLVACDNENTADTTETKTETLIYATNAQFKKDYEAIQKWDKFSKDRFQKHIDIMTKKLIAHKPPAKKITEEEIDELIDNMQQTVEEISDALDNLDIKSPDFEAFLENKKEFYSRTEEMLTTAYKSMTKSPEEVLEYKAKVEKIIQELIEIRKEDEKMDKEIKEKYKFSTPK